MDRLNVDRSEALKRLVEYRRQKIRNRSADRQVCLDGQA
jgi:hypothetical protein